MAERVRNLGMGKEKVPCACYPPEASLLALLIPGGEVWLLDEVVLPFGS